jgi:hypothetical protein
MVGVVVTAEPLYIINSPDWRQQLTPARIPTLFMSLRDLERMVLHDAVDLAPALKRIANDPELSTIQFTTALSKVLPEPAALRNPLLADATERLAL